MIGSLVLIAVCSYGIYKLAVFLGERPRSTWITEDPYPDELSALDVADRTGVYPR